MVRFIIPFFAIALAGCSSEPGSLPMATTPVKSRAALVAVLDAWKAGQSADDLKAQSTPLYFIDGDFSKGSRLTEYKIEDAGKPHGTGYRYDVTLTIERGGGKTKKVAYRVVTDPNTAISREDD